jgi:formylglycine-generating enzyme required for sulfatase activity
MTQQTEYIHDLFVSYADADRAWVEGYLLDGLTQAGVRCHSEAAFALGVPRLLEFERAVKESARTLLVLSPAYLAEGFSQFTDLLAQSYGLETATWPIIPLILHPVELPPRLAMLTALDTTDPAEWQAVVERLCAELQRPVPGPAPRPPCPYPGMVPFSEADSDRFFGRDEKIEELLERLRLHSFMTVIGPSGSGKSSLVFAGLIPALRHSSLFGAGEWMVRSLRPGEAPLHALVDALDGDPNHADWALADLLATEPDARRLLLIVDQFEELFIPDVVDGVEFQEALARLAHVPECYVVLTVRADFYPDLMTSSLWPEIQAHSLDVLPLDADGLRQAIVRPAEDVGVFVETALVERLLADAGGEPGILPFVQETLVLLWAKVERRFLPLRAYEALVLPRRAYDVPPLTGLQVAIARRADAALDALTPNHQLIARRIFLRLVQFGEGRPDTRRQQAVAALRVGGDDPLLFDQTLHHLAHKDNRLLILSGSRGDPGRRADLAHEALISGWPRLREWLSERREAELTRRRLEAKAAEWVRLGRGRGGLLDKVELLEVTDWIDSPDGADLGYSDGLIALVGASRTALRTQRHRELITVVLISSVVLALLAVFTRAGLREWVRRTTGTELIAIRDGPAIIGTDDPLASEWEHPERTVSLLPFQIERFEVTNRQYRACVESGPCSSPIVTDVYEDEARSEHPVVHVTAQQAHTYCTWLGRRLPTTAEWERAARGSQGWLWPWGDNAPAPDQVQLLLDDHPEYVPEGTVPVSSMREGTTPESVHHLVGNVWEWVVLVLPDCEEVSCHQEWDGEADTVGFMGGAYDTYLDRVTALTRSDPSNRDQSLGFRCVLFRQERR